MTPAPQQMTALSREARERLEALREGLSRWEISSPANDITEALSVIDSQSSEIERLRRVREIVELWFSPWGAAKGEMWEDLSNDKPFEPNVALDLIRQTLEPSNAD